MPPELDDTTLERKLFTLPGSIAVETTRPQPDWVRIHATNSSITQPWAWIGTQMEASETAAQVADRWIVVWSAPAFALGLMMIVAAAAWWLRSIFGRSEIKGLKAQISAAQAIEKTLEQRLSIAREQEHAAVTTRQQLEAQIAELRREVLFSPDRVRAYVDVLASTVTGMKTQQDALADTLGHPPPADCPSPTNTEARTTRTPT